MNFIMQWLRKIICPKCEEPKPKETIQLKPSGTMGMARMTLIINHKLREVNDEKADIYLPDRLVKIYKREDVKNYLRLDETDKIKYIAEEMDCDDFAAELFGKFAGLIWTSKHALNWFVDDCLNLWFIEPQTDKISKNLESWQGWDVRFILGR